MNKIVLLTLMLLLSACGAEQRYVVTSPDGALAVTLSLDGQGRPQYQVSRNGVTVVQPSQLGVVLSGRDLSRGLELASADQPSQVRGSYSMVQGKRRHITYVANEQLFHLRKSGGAALDIAFRVSDDGVAFQYRFPGHSAQVKVVDEERTSFAFAGDTRAWLQPIAVAQTGWKNTNPSYEAHYQMDIPVGEASPSPAGWVFPALFHTSGGWVLISESGMDGNYHGSRLQAQSPGGEYRIGLPMDAEVFTGGALKAQSTLPFHSPWRLLVVGELADLVDSTLGTDLAPPAIAEMPWVKPGLASWSWALLKDSSVNYSTQKRFIDYAAQMGWPYTLVDADWDRNIGYEKIAELADYAAQKNVRLLLWYNSSGAWNKTEYSPKGKLLQREPRRREFARLEKMGIAGIKIDFFAGDGKSMIDYYQALARDAADFHLLVNFHGATLPRGIQRTFPNVMTAEAVHGFEMITFMQASADLAPTHMAMLPFARNAFDPMDFTPTTFSEIPNIQRRTSNGFELALPIVFLSGLQHIAETDSGMSAVPGYVRDFMRDIPAGWDDSRFIDGYPGSYFVVARRAGDTWYLAGINGTEEEKTLSVDLSFIGPRIGELIGDGDSAREFARRELETGSAVKLAIPGHGGFVATFPPSRLVLD